MEAQPTKTPLAMQSLCGYPDLLFQEKDISYGLFYLPGNKNRFQNFKTLAPWYTGKTTLRHGRGKVSF